jgi:TPR repeat protein
VKKSFLALGCFGWLLPSAVLFAQTTGPAAAPTAVDRTLLEEGKHFLECLAYVYSPPLWISYEDPDPTFSASDFVDLRSLATRLTNRADPPSSYLWQRLSETSRDALVNYRDPASDPLPLQTALARELSGIVGGPSVYDPQRFRAVALRPETKELLSQNPQGDELQRLNRLLLEDAYPLEISSKRSLYFVPKDEEQSAKIAAMVAERAGYVALTNRETRHDLASKLIARSGVDARWQRKLLLPFSDTNVNLTPTLQKPFVLVPKYKVIRPEEEGVLEASRKLFEKDDALIQIEGSAENRAKVPTTYLVMRFGRGAGDGSGTNACLVQEGEITYATTIAPTTKSETTLDAAGAPPARFKTVRAFTSVSLSKEEQDVLTQVAAAFQKQAQTLAAILKEQTEQAKAKEEFDSYLAVASDSNPSMQFMVGKCYLEGRGTPKNEKLGLDWVNKAAKNGSGEAQAYLANLAGKPK